MVSAELLPEKEGYTFENVLAIIQKSLQSQINREHLEKLFSYNVSNEKSWIARIAPLPFKNIAMRHVYKTSALANTSTITNVGSIAFAEAYQPHIDMFHAFLSISEGQNIKGTICSYGDILTFSFSYDIKDTSIQRAFVRKLAADGLHIELESNGVHYE